MAVSGDKIILGSGKIYCSEYSSAIPDDETLEAESNLLGLIQGGATLEYTPEFYTAEDDLGLKSKTILTKEEVSLKAPIMTLCGTTFSKICSTARKTEASGKRTVKIGGLSKYDGKKYVIRFVYEDSVDGDIRITIVGNNRSGFTLAFAKDKETIVDVEFKALPHDTDGTKIIYEEDIPTV